MEKTGGPSSRDASSQQGVAGAPPSISMHAWRWIDARFEPCNAVPITDRGFRYGMSVFESVRVSAGEGWFLAEHLERLRAACRDREFPCDPRALESVGDLLRGCAGEAFARIYVTAGDGAPAAPAKDPRVFLFTEAKERPTVAEFDLTVSDDVFHAPFGGLKTGNYWANAAALALAQRHGCDEALFFNEHAELVSACCANVFLVREGRVQTPALASGARDGVMREQVMRHLKVEERSLFLDGVRSADEIFLTNSWLGVMPVARVDGRQLASRKVSTDLARTLNR